MCDVLNATKHIKTIVFQNKFSLSHQDSLAKVVCGECPIRSCD